MLGLNQQGISIYYYVPISGVFSLFFLIELTMLLYGNFQLCRNGSYLY
jgi:hypothetical protein